MWTLIVIAIAANNAGAAGGSTAITTLDFSSKTACDAGAVTVAESGSAGSSNYYKIIAKCVDRYRPNTAPRASN